MSARAGSIPIDHSNLHMTSPNTPKRTQPGALARRILVVVGAIVVLVVLVVGAVVWLAPSRGNVETFPRPATGIASATKEFLAGTGIPLLVLDQLSRPVQQPPGGDLLTTCVSVVTALGGRLGDAKPADLAAQVPDPVLSELLLSEQAAVINGLSSCGNNDLLGARGEFILAARSANLVHRRLKELGS